MDLHKILLSAHRGFAYLELLLIAIFIVALVISLVAKQGKISNFLRKTSLFVMIIFHIQFLIGIIMLFFASGFMASLDSMGMGGLMKDGALRFAYIEHPFSMLLAAILMTVANSKIKKKEKITAGIVILTLLAFVFFFFAFPFSKLMGA